MRKRNYVAGVLAVAVAAALPAGASAAVTSQTINFTSAPVKVAKKVSKLQKKFVNPTILTVNTASTWSSYGPPPANPSPATTDADIDFDNDFVFNTKGIPTCNPSSLAGTTTEAATAVCSAAKVGSGTSTLNGAAGPLNAVVTAFNGTPVNGQPQILLHTRTQAGALSSTVILPGVLQNSPLRGDFGKRLHVDVPAAQIGNGFEVITSFNTTITKVSKRKIKVHGKKKKIPVGYVGVRCKDKNRKLDVSSVFSFGVSPAFTPSSTFSAVASSTCAPKVKKVVKK